MWGSFLAPTATAEPHAGRTGLLDIPLSILHQKNFDIPLEGGPKRMTAKAHRQAPEGARLYDTDVVAWANEQAQLLRSGRLDQLDIEHIAEEIEDVGKSEQRELASRMSILLAHLLKWQFRPKRRGAS